MDGGLQPHGGAPAQDAPALLAHASLRTHTAPAARAKLGDAYVLQILRTERGAYAAAASAPDDSVHLFAPDTLKQTRVFQHNGGVTAVCTPPGLGLVSAGRDANLVVWDERTGAQALTLRSRGRPRAFLCVDGAGDGHTLAAGTALEGDDALVHIFDTRSPGGALRSHSQTHSEDVATVRFAPGRRLLLSAGTDGLVCTSDPDQDDEDEAGVHVGNWGCSVARAGWIEGAQPGKPAVWAASDMETFSLWSEELDLVQSFDIRKPALGGVHTWTTDYLITAQTSAHRLHANDTGLRLFVGSNEGALALLAPGPQARAVQGAGVHAWAAHARFDGPHAGVVRSAFWDEPAGVLLSGGEDGTLCAWACPPLAAEPDAMDAEDESESAGVASGAGGLGGRGVLREDTSVDDIAAMDVDAALPSPHTQRKKRGLDLGPGMAGRRADMDQGTKKARRL